MTLVEAEKAKFYSLTYISCYFTAFVYHLGDGLGMIRYVASVKRCRVDNDQIVVQVVPQHIDSSDNRVIDH